MANPKKINLGVFAAGEIPYSFVHAYKDKDGIVINITTFTLSVTAEGPEVGPYGQGSAIKSDAANGEVTYAWAAADFQDVGKYRMLLWVYDGTNRLASDLVVWEVYDGPGATP